MIGIFKKLFGKKEDDLRQDEYLIRELRLSNKNRDEWKGQANVDATENIVLKAKLKKIRDLIGKDDEVFSKFSRDQIEDMSIEEFRKVESEIDKDEATGKLFLQ